MWPLNLKSLFPGLPALHAALLGSVPWGVNGGVVREVRWRTNYLVCTLVLVFLPTTNLQTLPSWSKRPRSCPEDGKAIHRKDSGSSEYWRVLPALDCKPPDFWMRKKKLASSLFHLNLILRRKSFLSWGLQNWEAAWRGGGDPKGGPRRYRCQIPACICEEQACEAVSLTSLLSSSPFFVK